MILSRYFSVRKPSAERIWEIDFLRGIAVVMMIVFHLLYDLNYFLGYSFVLGSGFWWLFARATAGIFVFLVGVSLTLSYGRAKKIQKLTSRGITRKFVKRGIRIFIWGMLVTALTWGLLANNGAIWFGVLHLIGISIILARPFVRHKELNLVLGIITMAIGFWLGNIIIEVPWLIPIGLKAVGFYTLDYLPIFPWFGLILIGLFVGNSVFPGGKRIYSIRKGPSRPARPVCFLGRHSLVIYLLHQPVIIGVLLILSIL